MALITRLVSVPHYAPKLAAAHAQEWQHLYSSWNEKTAMCDFLKEFHGDEIPTTLVLHDGNQGLIGSVSLVRDDLPDREDLNPWLASLYIMPQFRKRGYGRSLVQEAVRLYSTFGYDRAYLFTETAGPYFARFGFVAIDSVLANGRPVTIMERTEPFHCSETGDGAAMACCSPVAPVR
jgi:N-acetylglutamate synthase-like GNAT family acetyltransferase